MTSDSREAEPATPRMLQLLNAFLTVQSIHVAAVLGIADQLVDGPKDVAHLADAANADPGALYRILRMLAGQGVFTEQADGRFALSPLGECLRSDGPASVRDWALFIGAPEMWGTWGRLQESVMSGETAFSRVHGMSVWKYLAMHPDVARPFNRWMSQQSEQHNAALIASYDFSAVRTVVDVGGGRGSTLAAILRGNSCARGILLDLPHVVADVAPLEEAGVRDRCDVVAGDMLEGLPPGADVYLVKRVLMDWADEQAIAILRNCANALPHGGKVLAVEMILPPANEPSPVRAFDILMLLNTGGHIRTHAEFADLFRAAGLRLTRTIATSSPNTILEGELP